MVHISCQIVMSLPSHLGVWDLIFNIKHGEVTADHKDPPKGSRYRILYNFIIFQAIYAE